VFRWIPELIKEPVMWDLKKNGASGKNGNGLVPELRLKFPLPPDGPTDGSNGGLQRPITEFDYDLWNLGWIDGRLGQPVEDNEKLLRAYADLDRIDQADSMRRRIAQLRSEVEVEGELVEQQAEVLKKATDRLRSVNDEREEKLQEFSLALGIIYLLAGLLLFISDIPLSLRLVAEGYDIPIEARLPDGSTLLIDEVFVKPLQVIQYLWEPLILALGIALAGVFVKIFIDEVIWKSGGREDNPWRVRIFLSITALLFVGTLIAVGSFRAQRQAQQASAASSFVPSFAVSASGGSPVAGAGAASAQESPETDWGFWSFLSITLMLPIVGGICFLSGWSRIQKWMFLHECRRDQRINIDYYSNLNQQRAGRQGELAAIEEAFVRLEKERDPHAEIWQQLYRHGYWRGTAVPETVQAQEDLYQRCDRMLQKQLAAEARNRFWSEVKQPEQG
jgi:hypothetical protein